MNLFPGQAQGPKISVLDGPAMRRESVMRGREMAIHWGDRSGPLNAEPKV